jgi:hypothetical protein
VADDRGLSFGRRALLAYEEISANLGNVLEQLDTHELSEIEDYREPLSVRARKEVTVFLSWGGPSDGFKVYLMMKE